jgi:hypothetical protein
MVVPLALGSMDWRLMAAITAAIAIERLPSRGEAAARAAGVAIMAAGLFLLAV